MQSSDSRAATTAAQLATSITFLLSDDGISDNGTILASDGGWSRRRAIGTQRKRMKAGSPAVVVHGHTAHRAEPRP